MEASGRPRPRCRGTRCSRPPGGRVASLPAPARPRRRWRPGDGCSRPDGPRPTPAGRGPSTRGCRCWTRGDPGGPRRPATEEARRAAASRPAPRRRPGSREGSPARARRAGRGPGGRTSWSTPSQTVAPGCCNFPRSPGRPVRGKRRLERWVKRCGETSAGRARKRRDAVVFRLPLRRARRPAHQRLRRALRQRRGRRAHLLQPADRQGGGRAEGRAGRASCAIASRAETYQAGPPHHPPARHLPVQHGEREPAAHLDVLHAHPFYNSEQVSQRYVEVKPEQVIVPALPEREEALYRGVVEAQMAAYARIGSCSSRAPRRSSSASSPRRRRTPEKWASTLKKRCQEVARYVLPIGTFAHLYHTVSGLTLHRYHRLAEPTTSRPRLARSSRPWSARSSPSTRSSSARSRIRFRSSPPTRPGRFARRAAHSESAAWRRARTGPSSTPGSRVGSAPSWTGARGARKPSPRRCATSWGCPGTTLDDGAALERVLSPTAEPVPVRGAAARCARQAHADAGPRALHVPEEAQPRRGQPGSAAPDDARERGPSSTRTSSRASRT